MRLFNFFNKKPNSGVNKDIIEEIIEFVIKEEEKGEIALGRREDNQIFVSFKNTTLSNFFKDWFTILKLYKENELTKTSYEMFKEKILDKNNKSR